MRLPERDRVSLPKAKLMDDLTVAMGGRIAEEMTFGIERITTGASNDIKQVTDMVRRMVTEWGMSDKLGFLMYGEPTQEVFLGHSVTQHRNISESTAKIVDEEVRRIIDSCYSRAVRILKEHSDQLHTLAKALLEYETLSGQEIKAYCVTNRLCARIKTKKRSSNPMKDGVHHQCRPVEDRFLRIWIQPSRILKAFRGYSLHLSFAGRKEMGRERMVWYR